MLNSVIVNTETPHSLVLMTRSLPVEPFLLVRISFFSLDFFSQWNNYSCQDTRGGCEYSTNDGGEVVASAGSHVRSKPFSLPIFIHSWGWGYFFFRNREDVHFCHTCQFKKNLMVLYGRG